MADNITVLDSLGATKTIATKDDGTAHRQRMLGTALAVAAGSSPATVAAAAYADPVCDTHGFPYVNTGHPNLKTFRERATGAISNVAKVTPGSGKKLKHVGTWLRTMNGNTADVDMQVGFGASSNDASLYSHPGIAGDRVDKSEVVKTGAADEPIRVTAALTSGVATFDYIIAYVEVPS